MFHFDHKPRIKHMKNTTPNGKFWVSTNDTVDHGLETMVFSMGGDGAVDNWGELDVACYHTAEEAIGGHAIMLAKWSAKELDQQEEG